MNRSKVTTTFIITAVTTTLAIFVGIRMMAINTAWATMQRGTVTVNSQSMTVPGTT